MAASGFDPLHISGVLRRHAPRGTPAPVVFDSPHSGRVYPGDFDALPSEPLLRKGEDAYIHELYSTAPQQGAVLLEALFPRCYIDPNRHLADLDPDMLSGDWSGPLQPSTKTERGCGLIWRIIPPETAIYDRLLTVDEVTARIDSYWQPYHDALEAALDATHTRFGQVWHVNCHSMPAMGDHTTEDGPVARAPFVLGDRDGTTCDPEFADLVASTLRGFGHEVKLNDPYKGVELVRRHGRPAEDRHSLQIEINRKLYMDEATLEKSADFVMLQRDIAKLVEVVCDYAREQVSQAA